MKNTKCAMNCHVSNKINGNSVEILKYFYDYHDYCLFNENTKCAMNCHVNDKINGNSVEILKYFYDYCPLRLLLIYENYTMPIIANKIITIIE